jgi:hypothetical protein
MEALHIQQNKLLVIAMRPQWFLERIYGMYVNSTGTFL